MNQDPGSRQATGAALRYLVALALFVPFTAGEALAEELTLESIVDLSPPELVGDIQWEFHDGVNVVTWDGVSGILQEDPRILIADGLPTGPVLLLDTTPPSDDLLLASGGAPLPMSWDSTTGTFRNDTGPFSLRVGYRPKVQRETLNDSDGNPICVVAFRPDCRNGKEVGVEIFCMDLKGVPKKARNWYQFANTTVTWEGTDANGNPISGKYPYDVISTTNASNPITANGEVAYVDSSDETPEYEVGAMESDANDPDTPDDEGLTNVFDNPEMPRPVADAVADVIEFGFPIPDPRWPGPGPGQTPWQGLPPGSSLDRLIYTIDFTTYLEFCGKIIYRYDWSFRQVMDMNANPPFLDDDGEVSGPYPEGDGPPLPEPTGQTTTGMDQDHQQAFDNFTSDPPDFSGGTRD